MSCTNCGHRAAAHNEDSQERASYLAFENIEGYPFSLSQCLTFCSPGVSSISAPQVQQQAGSTATSSVKNRFAQRQQG
ncbi:hypothetical protein K8R03_04195 [Candidatus Kaiserbacteria bacterium]|nr:hypothetical protein [Candidatus Kaiserbacteria bacterium]